MSTVHSQRAARGEISDVEEHHEPPEPVEKSSEGDRTEPPTLDELNERRAALSARIAEHFRSLGGVDG
ncbi:hypothetical protein GCM10009716_35400 [Streptomyces sodiiphilus]|uniref:Uncharacterized protein n=1 Tax=Streptomyces sodiiphilus TaxID=226217 RepID=A0ABP5AXT6_9ACTN